MLTFLVGSPLAPWSGRLEYVEAKESFEFEIDDDAEFDKRVGSAGSTTMLLGLVQVMISVEFQTLLCAWGHSSRELWVDSTLRVPMFHDREIRLTNYLPLSPDVTLQEIDSGPLSFDHDNANGWLRISCSDRTSKTLIRIADGVAIGLDDDRLASIWLRLPSSQVLGR
jgi:hypothetical protein